MRVDQLPVEDKYFFEENDYRPYLAGCAMDVHAILHFRRPTKAEQRKV